MTKTIFITGASRGFGKIWAEAFLKRGDRVIATVRNPDSLHELANEYPSNLLVLQLDVTDKVACVDAVAKAKTHFGAIDVLINNAGYGHMGAIEELEEQEIRTQIETNVFGLLWITQAIIPIMREQKSGHIIQLSSALGIVAFPTFGIYSASKFAVEAISESLAAEVSGFGIKVTILEPNGYLTDFNASIAQSKPIALYDDVRAALQASNKAEDWGVPEATADAVLKLVDTEKPPLRLLLGKAGFEWIKYVYAERMKTWEEWYDVSVAAHGK
ncbi:SDR family NAD(P)-dependent oxidoreductase [Mucilaginibacter pocheonensis]|uniref:NAD(P)-dependent dehydrogenase (Short-subunit alcohol dehydrogenase family) n=1 Tax=Mucilaginibacter pocheonensis TaxID=398050 RepID=A0ABU1T7N3_9SPHI|nr:SDR family NAD(P)-dependent oxidoreductase [Mucilaginibacter pocheonensis]MDR6941402.1 NAD(P)-dependent dehydrogenase (short-subunit alcohol dehydrogenase family) [Mucilaginibacter pocheonensis]